MRVVGTVSKVRAGDWKRTGVTENEMQIDTVPMQANTYPGTGSMGARRASEDLFRGSWQRADEHDVSQQQGSPRSSSTPRVSQDIDRAYSTSTCVESGHTERCTGLRRERIRWISVCWSRAYVDSCSLCLEYVSYRCTKSRHLGKPFETRRSTRRTRESTGETGAGHLRDTARWKSPHRGARHT